MSPKFFSASFPVAYARKSRAVRWCLEKADTARLLPPRVEVPGPFRPGSGATPNRPTTLLVPFFLPAVEYT